MPEAESGCEQKVNKNSVRMTEFLIIQGRRRARGVDHACVVDGERSEPPARVRRPQAAGLARPKGGDPTPNPREELWAFLKNVTARELTTMQGLRKFRSITMPA